MSESQFTTYFQSITNETDIGIINALYNYADGDLEKAIALYYDNTNSMQPPQYSPHQNTPTTPQPQSSNPPTTNIFTTIPFQPPSNPLPPIKGHCFPQKMHQVKQAEPKSPKASSHEKPSIIEKCIKDLTKWKEKSPTDIYTHIAQQIKKGTKSEEENCPICLSELYDGVYKMPAKKLHETTSKIHKGNMPVVQLGNCSDHFYHKECLLNAVKASNPSDSIQSSLSYKCCICNKVYGILQGSQPKNGKMSIRKYKPGQVPIAGNEMNGTIEINYFFPNGTINGMSYSGTSRQAFLPDTADGNTVLKLLEIAFNRGLTFTVGTSVTTGVKNAIVWNGIHHKTGTDGGATMYGYPDPTYFSRIKEELAAKGVTIADIK